MAVDEIADGVISPAQIASRRGNALDGTPDADGASTRLVVDGGEFSARLAGKNRVPFGSRGDLPSRRTGGTNIALGIVSAGRVPRLQESASTVLGARGRLHGHLGHAVAVKVVHQELGIVGTSADVLSKIDAPHLGPVQLVRIKNASTRVP